MLFLYQLPNVVSSNYHDFMNITGRILVRQLPSLPVLFEFWQELTDFGYVVFFVVTCLLTISHSKGVFT